MIWLILGIAAILLNIAIFVIHRRNRSRLGPHKRLRMIIWFVGLGLAIPLNHVRIQDAPDLVHFGFPIPYAFFQLINGQWLDFVGPLTIAIWIINMLLCAHLLQLPITISMVAKRSREASPASVRQCG